MKKVLLLVFCVLSSLCNAQYLIDECINEDVLPTNTHNRDDITYDSRYGYCLSPHGQIRFLAVFVELEYDNPADDPYLIGTDIWDVGSLPRWADSLFAAYDTSNYNSKLVTKYYRYASSNNHVVLGDFLMAPDNYMQDPTSQQGFNRYAYCMYNPLKYIDPSGEQCYGYCESGYYLDTIIKE